MVANIYLKSSISNSIGLLLAMATVLFSQGINPSYNWIVQDGFKAVYTYIDQQNNVSGMQQFKNAGLNSLIIHFMGRTESSAAGFPVACDTWKTLGNATGLKLFMSITFGSDERYGNTEFGEFVFPDGGTMNAPCPQSQQYWERVYGDRAKICAQKGFDGCLVDVEMYSADQTRFYHEPCICDSCWSRYCTQNNKTQYLETAVLNRGALLNAQGLLTQYKDFQESRLIGLLQGIRASIDSINPGFMLGYLYYFEEIYGLTKGLGTTQAPALILDEYSYGGVPAGRDGREYNYLGSIYSGSYPGLLMPGFSPNELSPSDLVQSVLYFNTIKYQNHSMSGFWFYSSGSFLNDSLVNGYGRVTGYSKEQYIQALRDLCDAYTGPSGMPTTALRNPRSKNDSPRNALFNNAIILQPPEIFDTQGRSIIDQRRNYTVPTSSRVVIERSRNGTSRVRIAP